MGSFARQEDVGFRNRRNAFGQARDAHAIATRRRLRDQQRQSVPGKLPQRPFGFASHGRCELASGSARVTMTPSTTLVYSGQLSSTIALFHVPRRTARMRRAREVVFPFVAVPHPTGRNRR